MKENTCCFTGHRTNDLPKNTKSLYQALYRAIDELIKQGVTNFIAGGATGFDTMAALAVIDFKQQNRKIKLTLYLPCKGQESNRSRLEKEIYYFIYSQADEVVFISEQYSGGCMHKRNRAMVDNSIYCIAYLNKEKGGTFYTVSYARNQGLRIINLADSLQK